jgi:hypothetical protein
VPSGVEVLHEAKFHNKRMALGFGRQHFRLASERQEKTDSVVPCSMTTRI